MIPTRLALVGFTYGQTFLFTRAIDFLIQHKDKTNANTGYGLIAATFIIYVGIAVSEGMLLVWESMSNLGDRFLLHFINSKYLGSWSS
jgi:hypothetical protein